MSTCLYLLSVYHCTRNRRESVATGGVNVNYPSTMHQHEIRSTLPNHVSSITIRINQLFYQVIVVRLVRAINQLVAILVHCSNVLASQIVVVNSFFSTSLLLQQGNHHHHQVSSLLFSAQSIHSNKRSVLRIKFSA